MITAETVFNDHLHEGLIYLVIGSVMVFVLYKGSKKNTGAKLLAWFFILDSFLTFYNSYGLRDNSTETVGVTNGIRNAYRRQVLDYKYEFNGEILEGHTSPPNNSSNIILNGGKYKVHVFKSFVSHECWIDFSKPVE